MDKLYSKILFERAAIPQADYIEVRSYHWLDDPVSIIDHIQDTLHFPVFVKPARMGSSVGISRADSVDNLKEAIELALQFDHKVMVETGFEGKLEVECAVLGNAQPQASVVGEIRAAAAFYDYQSKYVDNSSEVIIPAPISDVASARVQALAIKAFKALDGSGLARADFFVDPVSDEVWINEVNTLPGFTPISMYPKLWAASGLPYPQLVAKLISLAVEQFSARNSLKCSYSAP
jgi:D-alanine-D-alanine ligase